MKAYNTTKLSLIALATLLCSNIWAQVTADFTSNFTSSCSVPVTVQFNDLSVTSNGFITSTQWDFGNNSGSLASNPTATYYQSGTYDVSLTTVNSLGQSNTMTKLVYIDLTGALQVAATVTDTTCGGCNDGTISLSVTGGLGPYTYFWSTGETTATISGLSVGTYNVTVTDGNTCTFSGSYVIGNNCSAMSASISLYQPISCFGDANGILEANVSNGMPPYSYSWLRPSNGGPPPPPAPGLNYLTSVDTGYHWLTVTDWYGCTSTSFIHVNQPDEISLSADVTYTTCGTCTDGDIDLSVSGGTSSYTYSWTQGANTQDINNLAIGNYNVTVADANNCYSIGTYLVDSCHLTIANIVTNPTTCFGAIDGGANVITAGGNPPYTYLWNNGATGNPITNLSVGAYTVTVTDGNGCSATDVFIITQPNALSIAENITPTSCPTCNDGAIDVTVSGGTPPYSFLWYTGNTTEDIFGLPAGLDTLVVYDANGCSVYGYYNVPAGGCGLPFTVTATDVTCYGGVDGTATVNVTSGQAPYTYMWSTAANTSSLTNLPAGTYYVTVSDDNNCAGVDTFDILQPLPILLTDSVVNTSCPTCNDGEIHVFANGGTNPYLYNINGGTYQVSNVFIGLAYGTYNVGVQDVNGCTESISVLVDSSCGHSSIITVIDVTCNGFATGSASIVSTGGTPPYTYSWNMGATGTNVTNLAAGTYSVIVTDANNCDKMYSFTINQPTALSVTTTVGDASCLGCNDGSITANVTGGVLPYTYVWASNPPQTTQTAASLPVGNYSLTITDANGCTATASATVNGVCNLTVDLGKDTAVCFGVFTLNSSITGGTGPYIKLWSTGDTAYTSLASIPGTYILDATDQNGCSASDTIILSDANPAATVSNDTTICLGGTASLLATGGTSYDWTGGLVSNNNIENPTTSPTQTSLYFVEIDNGSCISVRYVVVTVDSSCTWPGDADNSGLADNDDVLAIGIGYGDTGPTRSFASLVWEGQRSGNWTNSLLSGTNYKHIDTDGNGTIDDDDTLAISLNYGLSHPKREDERETTMPMIFVELPDSVSAGQTVQGALVLGTDSFPLSNMYGIKFTMNYNTDFIEENTVSFSFGPSWMGTPGIDMLTFQKDLYANGRIDGAITGINHINRGGFGNIGIVNFTMKDDISGKDLLALPMVFDFVNIRAINANEGLVDVEGGATTVIATQEVTGIGSVKPTLPVAIYPNPAQNVLYINTYGEQLEGIQVRNMLGETFALPMTNNDGVYTINTASISAGVYILTIQSQNHVAIERIVINK